MSYAQLIESIHNELIFSQISAITADNVDTYKNAVNKLTDCMDANIKTMYTVMAKTEELSNKMKSTEALAARMFVSNNQYVFYTSWNF